MAQFHDDRVVEVGQKVSFYYPSSNGSGILQRVGVVEKAGQSFLCIKHADGNYRSYRWDRMVGVFSIHGQGSYRIR